MTRGKIVLVTNKTTYTSVEFNGGMYWDWFGKEIVPALQKVSSYKDYVTLVTKFNSNHFEYPEMLTNNLRTFKQRKLLRLFDMSSYYLQKWFSDYLYIKNISGKPLTVKTRNNLIVMLNTNGVLILNFGKYTEECSEHSTGVKLSLTDEFTGLCENLNWYVKIYETEIEFEKYSPEGEDFLFYVSPFDIPAEVQIYAENFDADEHAEMWIESRGKRCVPPSIRDLINDADAIQKMLTELSEQINHFTGGHEL